MMESQGPYPLIGMVSRYLDSTPKRVWGRHPAAAQELVIVGGLENWVKEKL